MMAKQQSQSVDEAVRRTNVVKTHYFSSECQSVQYLLVYWDREKTLEASGAAHRQKCKMMLQKKIAKRFNKKKKKVRW